MKFTSTVTTVLICIGLNTSLCTGGIFSAVRAVSDVLAKQGQSIERMSHAPAGYLTCAMSSPVGNGVQSKGTANGCTNAKACLTIAQSQLRERTVLQNFHSFVVAFTPLLLQKPRVPILASPRQIARAGPLYEDASSLSHSLMKRE